MNKVSFTYYTMAIAAALSMASVANAQYVTDYKKAGDHFYAKGDYNSAAEYYSKYLDGKTVAATGNEPYQVHKAGKSKKTDAAIDLQYKLAESYRQIHDYSHAENWYKNVADQASTQYPLARYWYAISLRANGKYPESKQALETFIQSYTANDSYLAQAKQELANNIFIQNELAKQGKDVAVNKLSNDINKEGASYAASFANDNTIVFTSTRAADSTKKAAAHVNDMYQAVYANNTYNDVQKLNVPAIKDKEQGVAAFTPDGKKIFFTRWSTNKEGKKLGMIYESTKTDAGAWSEPAALGNNINVEGSDSRQPQVSADGQWLLFASDRQGGEGGFDIWYAPLENGAAGKAVNAGNAINTKQDDEAPFYHAPSNSLVFASNGRTGMGGFDLYTAKGNIGNTWSNVANLGYPVNSVKDDIYFVTKGDKLLQNALVSSDRSSLCCLELFEVNKTYKQYFTGKIIDCNTNAPIQNVTVVAQNSQDQAVVTQTTNADGVYVIEALPGSVLKLATSKTDYEAGSVLVKQGQADTVYNAALCMTVIKKTPAIFEDNKTFVSHNIGFAFAKKDLTPASYPYLDEVVAYMKAHPDAVIEVDAYTDEIGTDAFNKTLSEQRAEACVDYLVKAGIAKDKIVAKGLGSCCPIEKEKTEDGKDNPAAREKNRRVEFKLQ